MLTLMRTALLPILVICCVCLIVAKESNAQKKKGKGKAKGKNISRLVATGEPKQFHGGKLNAYAVWRNKNDWHLRVTTAKTKKHFKGTITAVGGTITKVQQVKLEKKSLLHDHIRRGPKKRTLFFDFRTDEGVDGINFQVSKGTRTIEFDLHIDGKHRPDRIFVGAKGQHPRRVPFSLPVRALVKKKK